MDIVDWEELIDETVEDVVIVDGIKVVGLKVELEIGWGEEYIGVSVWTDVNEDLGIEVNETVEISADWCSEVENEVIVVGVVTLIEIEPKQDNLSISRK